MNIRRFCIIILTAALLLMGCSYEAGAINEEYMKALFADNDADLAEKISVKADKSILVALPQSHTSIYINRLGYSVGDEKKAVFFADKLGDTFKVVNAVNKTVIYTGKIEEDNGVKIGDFSNVSDAGKYYIETDYVGRSYNFNISDSQYKDLFADMLNGFYNSGETIDNEAESIIDACFGMDTVIYAMQCNGDVFGGESNIVEQLLHMSDDLISMQESDGSIANSYEATAAFCGIISMCCGEFGKYEATIEESYKEAALKAWKWLEKNDYDTAKKESARFYAAAQLYSLLQTEDYKTISEGYLSDKGSGYSQSAFDFYGSIAYMNSKAQIDMSLCTYVMMDMIQKADEICVNVSSDKVFRVGTTDIDEVMADTAQICFFNYLVPSSEYIDVLSSAVEYIGGCNPDGINYMEEYTDNIEFNREFEYKSVMLFAVSNLCSI